MDDVYWDIIDDSTGVCTTYWREINGVPFNDTIEVTFKYRYIADSLKFVNIYSDGVEDYYLDTIEKTLTYTYANPGGLPISPDKIVYTLME